MEKASRRRTWCKLSLVVDPLSQEIIDNNLTTSNTHDSFAFLNMLPKLPKTISRLWGDRAYDTSSVYDALHKLKIQPVTSPQRNSRVNCENYRKGRYLSRGIVHQGRPALIPRDCNIIY